MLYYCNNTVDKDLMQNCQKMVCSFYQNILLKIFHHMGLSHTPFFL